MFGRVLAASLAVAMAAPAHAADFSYRLLLTDDMRLDKYFDFESAADQFMQCFRKPVWTRVQKDEFELRAKRTETIGMMKAEAAGADINEPVEIVTTFEFGDYDFGKQRFALRPLSDATFYSADAPCSVNVLPPVLRVFFSNGGVLDGLPMAADKAKAFLDGRRNQFGTVNRTIQATVTFKVTRFKGDGQLVGEIQRVVLTDLGPMKLGVIYSVPN